MFLINCGPARPLAIIQKNIEKSVNQILIFIYVFTTSHRNIINEELLSSQDKLDHLLDDTEEGINNACLAYNQVGDPASRFKVFMTVVVQIISLMHW